MDISEAKKVLTELNKMKITINATTAAFHPSSSPIESETALSENNVVLEQYMKKSDLEEYPHRFTENVDTSNLRQDQNDDMDVFYVSRKDVKIQPETILRIEINLFTRAYGITPWPVRNRVVSACVLKFPALRLSLRYEPDWHYLFSN
jgi:hypothetical protein